MSANTAEDYFLSQYETRPVSKVTSLSTDNSKHQISVIPADKNRVAIKDEKGNTVYVSSAAYVESLEKKINQMEQNDRTQKAQIQHLHTHLIQATDNLKSLAKKYHESNNYDGEY